VLDNTDGDRCRWITRSPFGELDVPPPNVEWVDGDVAVRLTFAKSVDFSAKPAPELLPSLSGHDC
jgi:hypothetical protein